MATDEASSSSSRISTAFQDLVKRSAELNAASDDLAKAIAPIDAVLKQFNLGVNAWHRYGGFVNEHDVAYENFVGYAKVNGKWGLALSHVFDHEREEEWLFNDAPRAMRIEAVKYLPDLLEILAKRAAETSVDLRTSADEARKVSATLVSLAQSAKERGK
jgi:hypothetical protein